MYDPNDYFTPEQIKSIRLLGAHIEAHPVSVDYQQTMCGEAGYMWSADLYTKEMCRCLSLKEEEWDEYNHAHRFDFWQIADPVYFKIICHQYKINTFLQLKERKNFSEKVWVVESARGIDVLLASFVKDWEEIRFTDQNISMVAETMRYMKSIVKNQLVPWQIDNENLPFESIGEPTIVCSTNHNILKEKQKEILGNGHILAILNGEVLGESYNG